MDSEGKQKKKQRGFSKTCFRKKVVGRYCTLYAVPEQSRSLPTLYLHDALFFSDMENRDGQQEIYHFKVQQVCTYIHTCNDVCTFSGAIV